MYQIAPNEYFPIVRQLDDPLDSGTYYVQAKVYRGRDNALIQTVNLTDNGSQNFTNFWQVPADTSGNGTYIYIITTVFTDSGFTTKSAKYGIQSITLLIQNRITGSAMGGSGGYANISYSALWRGISDELEALIKKLILELVKIPEVKEIDYKKIDKMISEKVKEVDYEMLKSHMSKEIKAIPNMNGEISKSILDAISKGNKETVNWVKGYMREYINLMDRSISNGISKSAIDYGQINGMIDKRIKKLSDNLADAHSEFSKKLK